VSDDTGQSPGSTEPDLATRLAQLAALHSAGDLSDDEFELAKRNALGLVQTPTPRQVSGAAERKSRWINLGIVGLILILAAVAVVLVVTRPGKQLAVEGTFTISNATYDRTDQFSDPNYHNDGVGGCEGYGGYEDLNSITQVVVDNDQGKEIARTELGSGTVQSASCVFTFNFDVRKGPKYFVVTIGDRGSSQYTYGDLSVPGSVALIIGNTK
jgi:hypothetical protein